MGRFATGLLALALAMSAGAMEGVLRDTDNDPVPFAYLGVLSATFQPITNAITEMDGTFSLAEPVTDGFLVVQPAAKPDTGGMQVFTHSPRLYELPVGAEDLKLQLPEVGNLVLEAYDADGDLMRWQEHQRNGEYAGRFAYAVNLDDEAVPYACWPVHGTLTGASSGPREAGLPAILVPPGRSFAVNLLFWPTQGYGKLLLKMDNAGEGFTFPRAGASQRLLVNLELARTAVADLQRRKPVYHAEDAAAIDALSAKLAAAATQATPRERAAAADTVLAEALQLRDELELARAERTWTEARQGTLKITVANAEALAGAEVTIEQDEHAFLFGAYEGAPFRAAPYEQARAAGFNLATVLLGWNWTQSPKLNRGEIDRTFGISALKKMGYAVKAHGVVWMQAYGILPDSAFGMRHDQLLAKTLDHQKALLEVFGEKIDLWEAVNEPANTNVVGLERKDMIRLLEDATANLVEAKQATLVNNPHEFSLGSQYLVYTLDNTPVNPYPLTYSDFLRRAAERDALAEIDVVALQVYPGYHLNEDFAGVQGPAFTPSYLLDTVDRYARFGKRIHISEFSLPSTYGDDWSSGYWRAPWTEVTQADYTDAVLTMMFAHPLVDSLSWWDLTDRKPSVLSGGLLHPDGTPKKAFERIQDRLAQWRTTGTLTVENTAPLTLPATAGRYTITLTMPDGDTTTASAEVTVGATTDVSLAAN